MTTPLTDDQIESMVADADAVPAMPTDELGPRAYRLMSHVRALAAEVLRLRAEVAQHNRAADTYMIAASAAERERDEARSALVDAVALLRVCGGNWLAPFEVREAIARAEKKETE